MTLTTSPTAERRRGLTEREVVSRYLLIQTVSFVITLWAVLTLVFLAMRALPGDAATIMGGLDASASQVSAMRAQLGLDRSLPAQYITYLSDVAQGDLGASLRERRPVVRVLVDRMPVTLTVASMAFVISLVLGLGLGLLAGLRPGGTFDRVALLFTTVALALPEFWFGFLLILLFAVQLGWFPVLGLPPQGLTLAASWHLLLPAVTLAIPRAAQVARLARARVLEERSSDYVRTARSKGLRPWAVAKHIASNSLPGTIPLLALELGGLLTGTIVVEQVFGLPGLGATILGAIGARDYPVVQGVTILAVTVYVLVNWLADIMQVVTDPRLRVS
ncbi:MAG TPA: ABC transporter permease [Trueperaceae bacterium]|nr:ABC transporter permease [Trueperaceae bacterium]HRP46115.1 ABC transporter permease [Trueperaceae bacterium]